MKLTTPGRTDIIYQRWKTILKIIYEQGRVINSANVNRVRPW